MFKSSDKRSKVMWQWCTESWPALFYPRYLPKDSKARSWEIAPLCEIPLTPKSMHMPACVRVRVYVCVCARVCAYVYMCMCVCIYIYIVGESCMYTYIRVCVLCECTLNPQYKILSCITTISTGIFPHPWSAKGCVPLVSSLLGDNWMPPPVPWEI